MNMARASENDLNAAVALTQTLESLFNYKSFPETLRPDDTQDARFDRDDPDQCREVVAHLADLVHSASLMRVVFGMAVLLDPESKVLNPDVGILEVHPEIANAQADVLRLDWVMHNITGKAWRDIGVEYSAGCDRASIDNAKQAQATPKASLNIVLAQEIGVAVV